VRHTPDGTTVLISATSMKPGTVRLTVEDSGPGVPAEALPHLFEKFYRPRQRGAARRTGTGIGLAVVRGLVEALGGTAQARASALGGLAVDLDLPAANVAEADAPMDDAGGIAGAGIAATAARGPV